MSSHPLSSRHQAGSATNAATWLGLGQLVVSDLQVDLGIRALGGPRCRRAVGMPVWALLSVQRRAGGPGPGAWRAGPPRGLTPSPVPPQAGAALLQRQRPVLPGAEPVLRAATPVPGVAQRHPAARGRAGLHGALPARRRVPPLHRRVPEHLQEPPAVPSPQVSGGRAHFSSVLGPKSPGMARVPEGRCWSWDECGAPDPPAALRIPSPPPSRPFSGHDLLPRPRPARLPVCRSP